MNHPFEVELTKEEEEKENVCKRKTILHSIPFVEKYRPSSFENIVLEEKNRKIFESILEHQHFPNLLFFGPPGAGKTTTIINLIQRYQTKSGVTKNKSGSMIHLNASDDRGIETCRTQIYNFVNSHSLFDNGLKFIVLDEVDYMTKVAQHALKYMIQTKPLNVRFCLICNYLSKIDEGLQNEFVTLRFNQLPKEHIFQFLYNIVQKEEIQMTPTQIQEIQHFYQSDIRSMINCLQTRQQQQQQEEADAPPVNSLKLLTVEILYDLFSFFSLLSKKKNENENDNDIEGFQSFQEKIQRIPEHPKNIFKRFFTYIIKNQKQMVTSQFLTFVSEVVHFQDCPINTLLFFVYQNMIQFSNIS